VTTIDKRFIVATNASIAGRLVILAIKASGYVLAPVRYRMLWRACNYFSIPLKKGKFYCTMRIGAGRCSDLILTIPTTAAY
jgi:hypothetical protein